MAQKKASSTDTHLPPVRVLRKRRRRQGLVWLIPIVAALIGLSIIWHEVSNRGPLITISFQSAAGLEEGKTQIRYRDVVVGVVENIRLSDNRNVVLVEARLDKNAEGLAGEGTVFWVVRPSIGLDGVSGLATLFSGSYIEADSDRNFGQTANQYNFEGLEKPPSIKSDRPGRVFRLRADSLGSLSAGTPVYFLRIPVGIVTGYELDKDGQFLDINIFIDAPYDQYVHGNTRFWNESGLYFNVSADGLTVRTESLASIITGGLAFASFGEQMELAQDAVFKIYQDREQARQTPTGIAVPVIMQFAQSSRGLEPGAPIRFQGLLLGRVDQVELRFDREQVRLYTVVKGTLYPASLGPAFAGYVNAGASDDYVPQRLAYFVQRGLRAQMKTANILSGSSFISLGYSPEDKLVDPVVAKLPFHIPTVPSEGLEDLQKKLSSIIDQLGKIPFESIGQNLDESLEQLRVLAKNVDDQVTPELTRSLKSLRQTLDSLDGLLASSGALPGQFEGSMQEMDRAIRSARALIDDLRATPNALIFGTPEQTYSRETLGAGGP